MCIIDLLHFSSFIIFSAISSDNKGFRMLSKLGWNKGEALGKTQGSGGLLEPVSFKFFFSLLVLCIHCANYYSID